METSMSLLVVKSSDVLCLSQLTAKFQQLVHQVTLVVLAYTSTMVQRTGSKMLTSMARLQIMTSH